MKIHKNDNVIIIAGKDKGKKGKVIKVLPKENKVVVEGANMKKKHQKPKGSGQKGQVIEFASAIDVSNVMFDDPKTKKPTRIRMKLINNKYVRVTKDSGSEIK